MRIVMNTIEIRKGDTIQLNLNITVNGEPFVPTDEKIVFSVGSQNRPLFSIPADENVVKISHEMTNKLSVGKEYQFDVRVYNASKTLVATPIFGQFKVLGVVNDDLS